MVPLRGLMGCGSSSVYSGTRGMPHHPNRNIRINIIEATSILDYEDTDTISSRRQTPVMPWQSQIVTVSSSLPQHKQSVTGNTITETLQLEEAADVSPSDRPVSPVPNHSKILHRTYTTVQILEKEEIPLVVH
ncbi:uncharacterized protein LOC131941789 [Physella acuta]|uniref:uncharacterized protein LOC131941789 n=1 Tax=Physella acuta TaxID=109671 RepID=UPI0027DB9671|nr:uncharacterized protein LOC131941789 [Physella acuta]XP_059157282.1 uncharacterized protein LOC131941789 [Physella acuta]XP_059157283.1 uncharacterized protein LOC131941789 [Physella acuta]XP_059157284.1 uncharacterized protein LOC131941789 [Physella acuta]XP_059157285.1 uncharacterized protein LOC131941789 [Physella acuta]